MLNTYGLRSVNIGTFNTRPNDPLYFPRDLRNIAVTGLRINNLVLNVLGYIPGISVVSGCVRIGIGIALLSGTLKFGNRHAHEGAIIGRWYDEAIGTATAQITRGILEAFVPFGWAVNATLDIIATPFNISKEILHMVRRSSYNDDLADNAAPHQDTEYPLALGLLHLA